MTPHSSERIDLQKLEAVAKEASKYPKGTENHGSLFMLRRECDPETIQALCEVVRAAQKAEREIDRLRNAPGWDVVTRVKAAKAAHSFLATALQPFSGEPFREKGEG